MSRTGSGDILTDGWTMYIRERRRMRDAVYYGLTHPPVVTQGQMVLQGKRPHGFHCGGMKIGGVIMAIQMRWQPVRHRDETFKLRVDFPHHLIRVEGRSVFAPGGMIIK